MEKKCNKKLIEQVRVLRGRGTPWAVVAAAVGVAIRTLMSYKEPDAASFDADFAAMAKEAQENIDCGEIKTGQFEQSVRHTLTKSYYEYRRVDVRSLDKNQKKKAKVRSPEKDEERTMAELSPPPEMPPTWVSKAYLIDYAEQVLDLIVEPNLSVPEIRAECLLRVKELTVTVKVKIVSEQQVDPSQAAVKNVLTNAGKKEDRWNFKEEVDLGIKVNVLDDDECDQVRDALKKNVG